MPQVNEFAVRFGWYGGHFIAQPKIQRQVWFRAPVILDIAAEYALPEIARREGSRNATLKLGCLTLQERRQVAKVPDSIGVGKRGSLRLHAFECEAKFDGVGAA